MSNDIAQPLPRLEDFEQLVKEANAGDPDALTALKHMLDERPEIWHAVADLGRHAQMGLIRSLAGGDRLVTESRCRSAKQMETELAGENCGPLERLAIKRVVSFWFEAQFADLLPMHTKREAKLRGDMQKAAQRRFDAAIKSLCLVRKLLPAAAQQTADSGCKKARAKRKADAAFTPKNRIGGLFAWQTEEVLGDSVVGAN